MFWFSSHGKRVWMGSISPVSKRNFWRGTQQLLNHQRRLCAALTNHWSQQPGREGHSRQLYFCFNVLEGWLGSWPCRRGWGRKWDIVEYEICGEGSGLHIPRIQQPRCSSILISWRSKKAPLPHRYMMSQATLTFLAWPRWLPFVNAAYEELIILQHKHSDGFFQHVFKSNMMFQEDF